MVPPRFCFGLRAGANRVGATGLTNRGPGEKPESTESRRTGLEQAEREQGITDSPEMQIRLAGVKLGTVEADGVKVRLVDADLARLVDEVCARKRKEFTVETLAEAGPVLAVRAMFREWGMDPSKYRPSSEALLRRVVQGKGLYRVSNVVDIGNLGSIETGWSYGCYDRSRIRPPVVFRHGAAGERYERVGKEMWHLEGRPVLSDADGPFGSPISDSTRTMVTESTREALVVIYAPATASDATLDAALGRLRERLSQFAGCEQAQSRICAPTRKE